MMSKRFVMPLYLFILMFYGFTYPMQNALSGAITTAPEQSTVCDNKQSTPTTNPIMITDPDDNQKEWKEEEKKSANTNALSILAAGSSGQSHDIPTTLHEVVAEPETSGTELDAYKQLSSMLEKSGSFTPIELEDNINHLAEIAKLTCEDILNLRTTEQRMHTQNALIGTGVFAGSAVIAWTLIKNSPNIPVYRSRTEKSFISGVLHFIVDQFGFVAGIGTGVVGYTIYNAAKAYFVGPYEKQVTTLITTLTQRLDEYEKNTDKKLAEHVQATDDKQDKHERKMASQLAEHKHTCATEQKELEQAIEKRQENFEKRTSKQFEKQKAELAQTTENQNQQIAQARHNATDALLTSEKLEKKVGKIKEKEESTSRLTVAIATMKAQADLLQEAASKLSLSEEQQNNFSQQLAAIQTNLETAQAMLPSEHHNHGFFKKFFKRERANSVPGPDSLSDSRRSSISYSSTQSDALENESTYLPESTCPKPMGRMSRRGSLVPTMDPLLEGSHEGSEKSPREDKSVPPTPNDH